MFQNAHHQGYIGKKIRKVETKNCQFKIVPGCKQSEGKKVQKQRKRKEKDNERKHLQC